MDAIDNADSGASVYNHPSANRPTASLAPATYANAGLNPKSLRTNGPGRLNPRSLRSQGGSSPSPISTHPTGPNPPRFPRLSSVSPPVSSPPPSSSGGSKGPGSGVKLQPIQYPAPTPPASGGNQGPQAS